MEKFTSGESWTSFVRRSNQAICLQGEVIAIVAFGSIEVLFAIVLHL